MEILSSFIVFEGLDGAGTTTQIRNLAKYYEVNGRRYHITNEPTSSPIGTLIRQILQKKVMTTPDALARLRDFLFGQVTSYHLPPHPFNQEGIVEAELTGGNLTLLHCVRSTTLECKHQTPVLFIEDVGENLYSIDRMLQSLKLAGKFEHLHGLIVGSFSEMKGNNFGRTAEENTLREFSFLW